MWRRVVDRKLENTANTATAKNQKAREKSQKGRAWWKVVPAVRQ
jgi:hypothetical protein